VLFDQAWPGSADDHAKDEGDENGVVELAGHGYEVGNEVERQQQVRNEGAQEELVTKRDALVTKQPAKQNDAVRDEPRGGARVTTPSEEDERGDEDRVQQDADAEADEAEPET